MSALLSPVPVMRFYDNNNNPLAGGQLWTYQAGTTTPVATYTDSTAGTPNTNPVILNARGEAPVWLSPVQAYKFILEDASGNTIWTADQITSPAPVTVGNMNDEKGSGGTPGFAANVDFTPGITTTLTLSTNYGSAANLWVAFDGAEQGADSFSLNGTTLTFNAPIPVAINKVYVKGGTALTVGAPGAGTVNDSSIANPSKLYNRINDIFDLRDPQYAGGAKFDGVTDDTAAINAALGTGRAGVYIAPAGTSVTQGNHTLQAGQYIVGQGQAATTFSCPSLTNDIFLLPNSNSGISNLTINGAAGRTAGRHIYLSAAQGPQYVEKVSITNYFVAIQCQGTGQYVNDISINNCTVAASSVTYGILISGGNDQYINNVIVNNSTGSEPTAGLAVTSCGGSWITNCDFIHCQNGVLLGPTGTAEVTYMFFHNVACDTSNNNGWYLLTGGSSLILGCAFDQCWGASATNYGFLAQGSGGAIQGLYFSNFRAYNNGLDGVYFQNNVEFVTMVGGSITGNSATTHNANAGVHIGANLNDFQLTGMRIGPDAGFPDTQLNQIQVDAGGSTRLSFVGCDLLTSNTAVSSLATGSNNTISGCTGCTLKGNVSTSTDASGHVTVTHNLGTIPKTILVSVQNATNAVFAQATGTATATTFQLVFFSQSGSVLASSGITFSWQIDF